MDNNVRNFDCFGHGWLAEAKITKPDLSKIDWKKGYTIQVQHFGTLDPLFGDNESDYSWLKDINFIEYVLEKCNKEESFKKAFSDTYYIEDFGYDSIDDVSVSDILDIMEEYNMDIAERLVECGLIDDIDEFALCGITDEEYLKSCLVGLPDDYEYDIVEVK